MFSTDFTFRQQENLVDNPGLRQPEMLGWIQAAMQQNTIFELFSMCNILGWS